MKIESFAEIVTKFNANLANYNVSCPKQMNLVFFNDAISHISRIARVLRQTRGNGLMIGVGGSGRQSLCRLAAFIREYTVFSIEITKSYRELSWKDDLRNLLKMAGSKNQKVCFLFSDTHIVKESFLEDINSILNTGEVPLTHT